MIEFQFDNSYTKKVPSNEDVQTSVVGMDHNKFIRLAYLGFSSTGLQNDTKFP